MKSGHIGDGRRRTRPTPKGRQVDPDAALEIRQLLADRSLRRDLLIENLHLIQDRFGHIGVRHIAALASEMRLAQAEVYEVATFYSHFDVVAEAELPPPPLTVRVCDGIACEMAGGRELLKGLEQRGEDQVRVVAAPCMGRCAHAPVAEVGHRHVEDASADSVEQVISGGDWRAVLPDYKDLTAYQAEGGYVLLGECRAARHTPEEIVTLLENSGLRGLGGAGFPAGRKWRIVRGFDGPRLMAVNADEGEPGTFKDRHYLESDPHRFIEGMLVAAWAVGVDACYIYVRDEYPAVRAILEREIGNVYEADLVSGLHIELRRGAGAYICGEESAMIESIEGKRGLPRNRPPYVAEDGLFGRPTLEHNVETLFWVPDIINKGVEWFTAAGRHGGIGWRSYSVSGRVRSPGVKLAPAGITLNELVNEYCDGLLEGHTLKGYLPGGASGGILPARLADVPLDFGALNEYGCFIGSHAVVVFSDKDDMRVVALNLMRFFRDESCGQCTPCRIGTEKCVALMEGANWDTDLLTQLCRTMTDASICGLGQAAANPVKSLMRFFPEVLA